MDLGNGVYLERLRGDDADLAEQVIHASIPRGLNHDPALQFGQLYSFWREIAEAEWNSPQMFHWDPSLAITEVIALSRFVLDNAHGFEFAGRVLDRSDGRRRIAPLTGYEGRSAYRARKDRFWFTTAESETLRTLLDEYRAVKEQLPDRVKRALWQADRSSYARYVTEATTHIVIGLESLLNTGEDEPITQQFVTRSKLLADELDIGTSRRYWKWVYKARSTVVHGGESKLVAPVGWDESEEDAPPDVVKLAKAQDVLRAAVRKTIEDDDFRQVFATEEAVREKWPLTDREQSG